MSRVLILRHPHHAFDVCADVIARQLGEENDLTVTVTEDEDDISTAGLADQDVVVIGSGLTHRVGAPGAPGTYYEQAFTPEQERALLAFVADGGGLIGLHITGWYLGDDLVKMVGGSANLHPPAEQTPVIDVTIADHDHAITRGVDAFSLRDDELYLPAWSNHATVLATAPYADRPVAVMWAHGYGQGRVFYSSPGHLPKTYEEKAMRQIMAAATRWCAGTEA
jgi:type 1 glutamine amidotransferase